MNILKTKSILEKLVIKGKKQVIAPFLHGKPGIGKSEIVAQLAEEMGFDFIDLRLSQLDSCDVRGIPAIDHEKKVSSWFPPEMIPFKGIERFEGTSGILFLDEINRARPDVLQSIFQLVYDRRVGEYELLDNWYIVAAGNLGAEDGTDVLEFDSALKNRFVYLEVEPEIDCWLTWARQNEVVPEIINYLEGDVGKLYVDFEDECTKSITPRTWTLFSDIIKQNDNKIREITELIGPSMLNGVTSTFLQFLTELESVSFKDVVERFEEIETKLDSFERHRIHQLNGQIKDVVKANDFSKDTFENIFKYLDKYVTDDHLFGLIKDIHNTEDEKLISFFKDFVEEYSEINVRFITTFGRDKDLDLTDEEIQQLIDLPNS